MIQREDKKHEDTIKSSAAILARLHSRKEVALRCSRRTDEEKQSYINK